MLDGAAAEHNTKIFSFSISVVCVFNGAGCIDWCNPTPVVYGVIVVVSGEGFGGCRRHGLFRFARLVASMPSTKYHTALLLLLLLRCGRCRREGRG